MPVHGGFKTLELTRTELAWLAPVFRNYLGATIFPSLKPSGELHVEIYTYIYIYIHEDMQVHLPQREIETETDIAKLGRQKATRESMDQVYGSIFV